MKKYKQLTLAQRYEIQVLVTQGKEQKEIASTLGVSKSCISREKARNSAGGKYEAEEAHRRYNYKKRQRKAYKLTDTLKIAIIEGLKADFSPEQIVGQSALEEKEMVSHETIYRFVYSQQKIVKQQQQQDSFWFSCLRSKRRKRRKRKNQNESRSISLESLAKEPKVSIDERPDHINNKERIGDCEIDTIIGKDHKGAILTLVERRTKHTSIVKLPNKSDEAVSQALADLAPKLPFKITSITADNGTEFADYAYIKKILNCDFFFAHPYCSWERGLNENTNGLIRQYIPKKSHFDGVHENFIIEIQNKLNNRPRKTLGFYNPLQTLNRNYQLITSCT